MKIAVPVEEKSMGTMVCEYLGRAPYFLIYSTVTKEYEFLDNRAVVNQGGSGIRVAQVIADNGVRTVIAKSCGKNTDKVFRNAEVFVYESIQGTVKDNIEAYENNKLNLLCDIHEGFHGKEQL